MSGCDKHTKSSSNLLGHSPTPSVAGNLRKLTSNSDSFRTSASTEKYCAGDSRRCRTSSLSPYEALRLSPIIQYKMGQKITGTPSLSSTPPSRAAPVSRNGMSSRGSVSAASWKTSNVRHIAQQVVQPLMKQASSLIHAYMVCGLNRDPTEWLIAPKPGTGRAQRTTGGVGAFLMPQILGSIPPNDRDEETVQTFSSALKVRMNRAN